MPLCSQKSTSLFFVLAVPPAVKIIVEDHIAAVIQISYLIFFFVKVDSTFIYRTVRTDYIAVFEGGVAKAGHWCQHIQRAVEIVICAVQQAIVLKNIMRAFLLDAQQIFLES